MVYKNRTRFFIPCFFATLAIFCFQSSYSYGARYADGSSSSIYYIYPPKDVSDERLKSIIERWRELQEDVKEEISTERQTKYRQTSYKATDNDLFYYFKKLNEERPDWFNPEQWENVDLKDCSLWLGSIAIIVEDEPKRYVEGSRFWASPIKEFGIPVCLEGLQRTKTWKERHADHMIFILEKSGESEFFLSFRNWLIENTSIYASGHSVNIDFSDALLLNVKLRGFHYAPNLKDLVVTRNFELGNIDDFEIVFDFPATDESPFLPKNWIYDGFLCYNRVTQKIELPPGISCEQFATSVLDASIESDKEVFSGIRPKDLYSTNAYRRGDLTGVKFFPKRIAGVDYSLQGWNLTKLNLAGACFDGLDLSDVDFTDSIISDTTFEDVRGLTLEQLTTTWNWKAKRMDSVVLPPELEKTVSEQLTE